MLLCLWCSLFLPTKIFSQTPNGTANLGILTSFGAYTGAGGVSNGAGASFTGDVGTNIGIISGFGAPPAFIGNTYNANATTTQARFDLFRFYIHLFDKFVDYPATHAPAFGGGETLTPGVYSIPGAGSIGGNLTLDGGGNSNAFFIIRWGGALTAGAGTTITLTGGTQSCNVFFMSAGAISIAASANLKGTLFAKVGAVGIGASAVIEGRMLSMEGAIVTGVGAVVTLPPGTCTIPIFCESGCSVAPSVDVLGVLSNYALFTSLGAVSNTSTSGINGKIGTNVGASSGYEASIVIGTFETANAATAQAKIDIDTAYNRLMALPNTVPSDLGVLPVVLLAHAAAFGSVAPGGETINAGVYFIGGAGSLSGTLTLDAQNNPNAIFVFKFAGAFGVATQTKIILANGARRCNVFFIGGAGVATGAVSIAAASELKGTFLSHGGACTSGAGLFLSGRLLSTGGAVTTYAGIVYNNPECVTSTSLGVPVILAVADTTTAVNGLTGGVTTSLTLNDRLGGVPVVIGTAPGNVTLSGVTVPTGLTLNANGTVTIAPNTPAGNYSLTYKICEVTNPSNCSTVTSTVTVTANPIVNPITGSDSVCVGSTTQLSSSPSGGVWSSSNTSVATVNSSTGVVTGVSSGTATISYTVTNSNGSTTVTVTNCTPPFAVTSNAINTSTLANSQLTGNASSQIAPTGGTQPYSYTGTTGSGAPSTNSKRGGSFIVDSTTGVYTYTPPVNYVGKDTFYITVCDDDAIPTPTCAIVTYTVQVGTPLSVSSTPAYVSTNANTPVSNNASSTMGLSGGLQPYTYSVANAAGNATTASVKGGGVTINPTTGAYTYTPATNFSGADTFYIKVCDAATPTNCVQQMFVINVSGAPFGVTSTTINASTPANTQLTGNASSQIAPTGGTQPYNYTGTNAAGSASTNSKRGGSFTVDPATGVYSYTPPVNYVGKDTFYIKVCDAGIPTPTCPIVPYIVQVGTTLSVNTAPAYVNTNANTPVSNNASSTMSVSGGLQPYTYSVANAAGNTTTISVKGGNVTINPTTGVYTYTPVTNFSGTDTFYIKVCDATTPTNCVQQMFIINVSGSVTSGSNAGVESKTLGDLIAVRLYGNAVNSVATTGNSSVKFVKSGVIVNGANDLTLSNLVPATVTNTDAAYVSTPTDLVNFTNAVEVLALDYTKAGSTKAVAFGTKTLGDVYTHTKPICDRLKGAELLEVKNITVNGFNLMAYKVHQRTGETEYAINLSAGTATNRSTISLQSNWFTDSYQQDEKLYNFQLWAVSYEMVTAMATDIITKLQTNGAVNTVTNADLPKAYISKGSRVNTNLTVTVQNNTTNTTGYFELKEKANEAMSDAQITTRRIPFTVNANGISNVSIPVRDNYEGNIYVYLNNKLTDLVYLSDGTWNLDYNKATTSIQQFNITNETPNNLTPNSGEHKLFRNVAVTGVSKDYITIYKTMMGGGLEQNVADFKSLLFNANAIGSGSVKVTLVKKSITNWNDQYSYTMSLDGDKEYGINLSQFSSTKYANAINANDIVAVNFSFNNSRNVPTNVSINLSKARFSTAAIASDISVNTIGIYPNPTTGKFSTSFNSTTAQSLVLKVTEAATGRIVKTQFINATKGANTIAVENNLANGLYIITLEGDGVKFNPSKLMVGKK